MLGCHIAIEVVLMLQNGLKFMFRESQGLWGWKCESFWNHFCSPEFSRGERGQICDQIAVGAAMTTTVGRLLHLGNEGPWSPWVASDGVFSLKEWIKVFSHNFSPLEGARECNHASFLLVWSHTRACSWKMCTSRRTRGCLRQRRSNPEHPARCPGSPWRWRPLWRRAPQNAPYQAAPAVAPMYWCPDCSFLFEGLKFSLVKLVS